MVSEKDAPKKDAVEQLDLFTDYSEVCRRRELEDHRLEREKSKQRAILSIKSRFGKNAVFKGLDLCDGATALERNRQIGGHRA